MKTRFVLPFLVFFLSIASYAQPSPEKRAKKITDKMTMALSLNAEDHDAVYAIQLDRFKERETILEEYADKPEMKKEKLKMLGNETYNKMKNYLGKERMKQWKDYQQNK